MSAGTSTRFLTAPGPGGDEVRVPVATVRGAREGPTVLVVAGIHPGEYTGIEGVRRLVSTIDPGTLAGTLVAVPCLSLEGFFGLAPRRSPVDGVDAGRAFPGDPAGSHTERLVHLVWERLARSADYVVDVHGGNLDEELVEFSLVGLTGDTPVDRRAEDLARALGLPILVRTSPPAGTTGRAVPAGSLRSEAGRQGIPAALAEVGGNGMRDEAEVRRLVAALRRGLGHLGLIPDPPPPAAAPLVLDGFAGVYAPVEGYWTPAVRKGAHVRRGHLLGEIRGVFGELLHRVEATEDALVLVVATAPPRRAGDILFGLGLAAAGPPRDRA